ncbi:MOSC domain-containing protein [Reyranella sp. CPCC 100927]|uniref:MOSC domain-containing protein n=1 Tax=Reyranella sp. CPCC 100927 TaxID=2599616 RepID=UPI0011B4E91A|nr:MOSC domain-containing protein [Reyranella sp. CPCC 100927]TWT13732.1 MOSC domain-containing protein [Reyranella sp. CPCC 100927]
MITKLNTLLIGAVGPLGAKAVPSGIDKRPVAGPVRLGRDGFEGDAQGDRKNHGGPLKAVHHYAYDHYDAWRQEIADAPVLRRPGAFGENLSTVGLDETQVALGDVFRLGDAVIEVSQGRQPCWRLNLRFGVADMAMRVQKTGRIGWYYRVIEAGIVRPHDCLDLIERRSPDWTLYRLWRLLYVDTLNRDELHAVIALPHLPERWRLLAERRLATQAVEDWTPRLSEKPAT